MTEAFKFTVQVIGGKKVGILSDASVESASTEKYVPKDGNAKVVERSRSNGRVYFKLQDGRGWVCSRSRKDIAKMVLGLVGCKTGSSCEDPIDTITQESASSSDSSSSSSSDKSAARKPAKPCKLAADPTLPAGPNELILQLCDPGLTQTGREEAEKLAKVHAQALSGIDVAFVSPLYRAALTACVMLPKSCKLIFTRDAAEFASDKFDKHGTPVHPKTKMRIEHREEELTGRTRRELESPNVLGDLLTGRDVEWDDIGLDDRWWDAPPESQTIATERVQRIRTKMLGMPRQTGVAIVCHSYWLKVAVPCSIRPRGTPNPLGTAAHYWPKNAVPYLAEVESSQLRVLRKLIVEDNFADVGFKQESGPRRVLLLRHGESEAQQRRKEMKDAARTRSRSARRKG